MMKYKVNIPGPGHQSAKLLVTSLKQLSGKVHSSSSGWQSAIIECSPEELTWLILKVGISLNGEGF